MADVLARFAGVFENIAKRFHRESREKRKGRTSRRRLALSVLAPTLFVIIAAVVVALFVRGAMSYHFDGTASQFYAGGEFKIPQGAVMRHQDGVSTIYYDTVSRDTARLPIYITNERRVVLPDDMVYYEPRGDLIVKLDYFSELRYDANGGVEAVRGGTTRRPDLGFLYDGKDSFLFLEPMTIRFNGYRIELSAMSYAEAVYDGQIMLYDRESGEFTMEAPRGAVTCESVAGDYVISLLSDYIEKSDGSRLLLFTKPELLDSYFK
jgi:hypothetical protein